VADITGLRNTGAARTAPSASRTWGQVLKSDTGSEPMIAGLNWVWLAMYEFKT
jgi:hypothetical protein